MIKYTEQITKLLNYVQFRVDTTKIFFDKPSFEYQPLPWVGIKSAGIRGSSTIKRWQVIKGAIKKNDKSLKDIGSCVGYFCISASMEYGMYSWGIDMNQKYLRIARYTTPQKVKDKCNFVYMEVDKNTVKFLPNTDITLCLSIWHHWVSTYGFKSATQILESIWNSTDRVLFFESGEEEVKEEFNLPFPDNQKASDWLAHYLSANLRSSKVEKVAESYAGRFPHYSLKNRKRSLFKITRKK